MLHKEVPFLRIGLPLCAGIVSGLYFKPDFTFVSAALLLAITAFLLSLWFNKQQTNLIFGFAFSISLYLSGLLLYRHEKESLSDLGPQESVFTGIVSDFPEEKDKSFRITVELDHLTNGAGSQPVKGSILLYNKKDMLRDDFLPGDILIFRCRPVRIENRGNPYEFDYRFFMENQGIKYYAFTSSADIIKHTSAGHRKLIHRALIARERIIRMFSERGIKGERLALVSAITLGQKSMLDPEQKLNFIKAGVMHIMAVSGLHAIIISLFVLNALFFMKRKLNILRICITILILWGFAFVTGLTPSVLRATLMFTFLQAGKLMKRPSNSINSVLASAFFLIILKPSVIFDAGFLLSYSAVTYIICFYQDFYCLYTCKSWLGDKIWQSAAVTMVAQAGTFPLTLTLFNRFPTYFILANITIVPVSNLLIIAGCLVPLFFKIEFLSRIFAIILNFLTGLTEQMTSQAASLPYSTIENIGMTIPECLILTCVIFLFASFFLKKNPARIVYPLIFLILFVIAGTIREISTRTSSELIVYNTPGSKTIGIRTGKILNLFSDTSVIRNEVKVHCAVLGLKVNPVFLKNNYYFLKAGTKKLLIAGKIIDKLPDQFEPDIVILTNQGFSGTSNKFNGRCEALVITSASGLSVQNSFANNRNIDSIHFVRKSGAFIKRI